LATDPINEYLATAKRATLQTAAGAEALTAAVHQRWSVKTGADADAAPAAAELSPAAMAPALTRVTEPVTLQGLGFFDFAHGQDGVAPNAIELHPVISIEFHGAELAHFLTV
jgi:hypothetical protein